MSNNECQHSYCSPAQENLSFYYGSDTDKNSYKVHLKASSDWGPKRDPLYIVIPITVVYAIIFFTGVLGNISTCIVIAKNRSMHTATNYYLFSLAISDLLLLVSALPNEMYLTWSKYPYKLGEEFCIWHGFAAETSANATVLTITAFTIERYVAICHPFLSHTISKLSRAIKFVIAIWIFAMCLAIPQALSFGIFYERDENGIMTNEDHYVCTIKQLVIPHIFEISTFVFFIAPLCLITVLYILIGLQLHRSTVDPSRGNSVRLRHRVYKPVVGCADSSRDKGKEHDRKDKTENVQLSCKQEEGRKNYSKNAQATKHVVKMLVAVVVAFFICWAPFHAQRLLAIYGQHTSTNMVTAFRVLTYISGILYYLSTTVNPLLYHIMSNKFRTAFKETFESCCFKKQQSTVDKCYETLSAKSSQFNSHSNIESCSRQSSLRYLDIEMARLQDSKRPIVVSFKRKKSHYPKRQVKTFESDLQEALDSLLEEPKKRCIPTSRNLTVPNSDKSIDVIQLLEKEQKESLVELHTLQPKHICPISGRKHQFIQSNSNGKLENSFLNTNYNLMKYDKKNNRRTQSIQINSDIKTKTKVLPKSNTMPYITDYVNFG